MKSWTVIRPNRGIFLVDGERLLLEDGNVRFYSVIDGVERQTGNYTFSSRVMIDTFIGETPEGRVVGVICGQIRRVDAEAALAKCQP